MGHLSLTLEPRCSSQGLTRRNRKLRSAIITSLNTFLLVTLRWLHDALHDGHSGNTSSCVTNPAVPCATQISKWLFLRCTEPCSTVAGATCGHWYRRPRAVGPALDVKKPHVPETTVFCSKHHDICHYHSGRLQGFSPCGSVLRCSMNTLMILLQLVG